MAKTTKVSPTDQIETTLEHYKDGLFSYTEMIQGILNICTDEHIRMAEDAKKTLATLGYNTDSIA